MSRFVNARVPRRRASSTDLAAVLYADRASVMTVAAAVSPPRRVVMFWAIVYISERTRDTCIQGGRICRSGVKCLLTLYYQLVTNLGHINCVSLNIIRCIHDERWLLPRCEEAGGTARGSV